MLDGKELEHRAKTREQSDRKRRDEGYVRVKSEGDDRHQGLRPVPQEGFGSHCFLCAEKGEAPWDKGNCSINLRNAGKEETRNENLLTPTV